MNIMWLRQQALAGRIAGHYQSGFWKDRSKNDKCLWWNKYYRNGRTEIQIYV